MGIFNYTEHQLFLDLGQILTDLTNGYRGTRSDTKSGERYPRYKPVRVGGLCLCSSDFNRPLLLSTINSINFGF